MIKQNYNNLSVDEVKKLTDRYMDGNTTLSEEQLIYDYFLNADVDAELLPMRDFFVGMAKLSAIGSEKSKSADTSESDGTAQIVDFPRKKMRQVWLAVASVAALFVLTFAGYNAYMKSQSELYSEIYEGSYVIVDGERNDNINEIRPQIEQALAMAEHLEARLEANGKCKDSK